MTVFLGNATLTNDSVQITAPIGFGSLNGVRITNYTGDVLVLTGISGENSSSEYLMPLQQMVYQSANVSRVPTVRGVVLGNNIDTPGVFIEWSDDMLNDFIGTYPTNITQVARVQSPSFVQIGTLALPLANTTYSLPANAQRASITVINNGTTNIKWATADSGWASAPIIAPGSGRSVDTTAALYFQSDAVNGSLEWFTD